MKMAQWFGHMEDYSRERCARAEIAAWMVSKLKMLDALRVAGQLPG